MYPRNLASLLTFPDYKLGFLLIKQCPWSEKNEYKRMITCTISISNWLNGSADYTRNGSIQKKDAWDFRNRKDDGRRISSSPISLIWYSLQYNGEKGILAWFARFCSRNSFSIHASKSRDKIDLFWVTGIVSRVSSVICSTLDSIWITWNPFSHLITIKHWNLHQQRHFLGSIKIYVL